ncbi:AcrR family transcriptional regulator [Nocardia transvalensis]|uniref:AcrR family transcriptional regulator n=1 Tax=Nocardia transvalensis TaxID=37333 RepID=A0A7W9PMY8_9NOCA|nr:TetR/AcrR family transcriptional regulator [Nocardia transvalensis]MBB5918910.1 AcrR family transcriptional regulator [Nocardia transvalensis]
MDRRRIRGEPEVLPRGVHRLSRAEVAASQRGRLMLAMAEVVAEKGYAATTVADVLKRARVSRLSFYEHFANKEACFVAAYDLVAGEVASRIRAALAVEGDPLERAELALGAYLETLAGEPALARLFLVDSYAAGPELARRRAAMHTLSADLIADRLGASTPGQRLACEAFVGAVLSLVTARIVDGDLDAVRELRGRIMALARPVWDSFYQL